MKFKYYLFLTFKNLKQKKINILNIVLLVITMTLIIVISSFSNTFANLIDNQVNGDIRQRAILVNEIKSVQSLKEEFSDIKGISYIEDYDEFSSYVKTDKGEELTLIGVPSNYLKILKGENIDNSTSKTLICPSKFYLGDRPEELNDKFLKKIVNGEKYLKKSLNINLYDYKQEYKVIGIYDVNKYLYGEYNICFTNSKNILEINNNYIEYMKKRCEDDENFCTDEIDYSQAVVIVDKVDDISSVEKELNNREYRTIRISAVNTDGIDFFINLIMIIPIIVLIVAFVILLSSNNKFILYNKKNNAIYKAMGYDTSILMNLNYLESIILVLISFFISILICIFLYITITNIYAAQVTLQMPIKISYISIIVSLVLTIFASLLSMYLAIKNNGSIMGEFNDAEI